MTVGRNTRARAGVGRSVRMFVAVVPPADAVEDLEEFLAPRRHADRLRWSDPDHFHLTLAFAGSVPDRSLDALVEALARAAERRAPWAARIAGGGAFPHAGAAKVLWAGVESDADRLDALARAARTACTTAGVEVDGTRFRPHVTVARSGRPIEATRWLRVLDAYRGPTWSVDGLRLVASHLGEGRDRRPRYEDVATLPFVART